MTPDNKIKTRFALIVLFACDRAGPPGARLLP